MTTIDYLCDMVLVDDEVLDHVALSVTDGRIASVTPNSAAAPHSIRLTGLTLPGLANAHSHAFHRALRSTHKPTADRFGRGGTSCMALQLG